MSDEVIPEDVKYFILQHIDSVAHLEALLLLRQDPQKKWNAEQIGHALYIDKAEAGTLLAQLCSQHFIRKTKDINSAEYYYQPKFSELESMMKRLAELYSRCLVPVTHLIHSKPKTRVQAFADAFKIRKD